MQPFWTIFVPEGPGDVAENMWPPGFTPEKNPYVCMRVNVPNQGEKFLPGKIVLEHASRMSMIDQQKPKGVAGRRAIFHGHDNPPIRFQLGIWRPAQWAEWQKIIDALHPKNETLPPAITIYFPPLNQIGVTALHFTDIGAVKLRDGQIMGHIPITCIQYLDRPQSAKKKTVTDSAKVAAASDQVPQTQQLAPKATNDKAAPSETESQKTNASPAFGRNLMGAH